jgi:hypothetical protein
VSKQVYSSFVIDRYVDNQRHRTAKPNSITEPVFHTPEDASFNAYHTLPAFPHHLTALST